MSHPKTFLTDEDALRYAYQKRAEEEERDSCLTALPQAAKDVLAERKRQVEKEGWTPEHDDQHTDGSLAFAAACYAVHSGVESALHAGPSDTEHFDFLREAQDWVHGGWPWPRRWWKPANSRSNLVKAAALILAEIERLDRRA